MLQGHYGYFAVPTNLWSVRAVRHHIKVRWYLSLWRRSQRARRMTVAADECDRRKVAAEAERDAPVAGATLSRQAPAVGAIMP